MGIRLDFEDFIEVFGEVELQSRPDGLPGLRGAAPAGGDRQPVFSAKRKGRCDILSMARPDDSGGHDLEHAGVGGVHRAYGGVERDVAIEPPPELTELC